MELTEMLNGVIGIIISAEKNPGELAKIKYRGGNERKIEKVVKQLRNFLSIKKDVEEFDNVLILLILNTELEKPLAMTDYSHVTDIGPQLSKCLLANIIMELNLFKNFCSVMTNRLSSLRVCVEIFLEILPCLQRCKPQIYLKSSTVFLEFIIRKLEQKSSDESSLENKEKLVEIASQILLHLTGLQSNIAGSEWSERRVYTHMGYTVLSLLNLLLNCNYKNPELQILIDKLIKTCCCVMSAVTIDVFCTWAEIKKDGEILQGIISEKSFLIIQHYATYKAASELTQMLELIARKPKSLSEQIQQADTKKIIEMVNKADSNQKKWFQALVYSQRIFDEYDETIECLEKWTNLCTPEDVRYILSLTLNASASASGEIIRFGITKVAIKAASGLNVDDLILLTTRYFHQFTGLNILNKNEDDLHRQLVFLLNKITMENNLLQDFTILLLQNRFVVLKFIFGECLKNCFYSNCFAEFFNKLQYISNADNIGMNTLIKLIWDEDRTNNVKQPNEENWKNFAQLFYVLSTSGFMAMKIIATKILQPLMENFFNENNWNGLKWTLKILNKIQSEKKLEISSETESFFIFIFSLFKIRCKFLDFDFGKMQVVEEVVEFFTSYDSNDTCDLDFSEKVNFIDDKMAQFYVDRFENPRSELLEYLNAAARLHDQEYGWTVSYLVKVLGKCVSREWKMIGATCREIFGNEKCVELLTDVLVLLCHLIKSQENMTLEVRRMLRGLKYAMENYGIAIRDTIKPFLTNLEEDVGITRHVCRLLNYIPLSDDDNDDDADAIPTDCGLSLIHILSDSSLKSLANSNNQIESLIKSVTNSNIRKYLTKRFST